MPGGYTPPTAPFELQAGCYGAHHPNLQFGRWVPGAARGFKALDENRFEGARRAWGGQCSTRPPEGGLKLKGAAGDAIQGGSINKILMRC